VDKADPLPDGSEHSEAEETARGVVVAGGDATAVLETVDEALDAVAQGIEGAIDRMLDAAVPLGRDFGSSAARENVLADSVAVVPAVGQEHLWVDVVLGHQLGIGGAVVSFAGGHKQTDRKTLSVGPKVDFGREATARAAKSLVLSPPFPPAAQWCARTMVLSIICTVSLPPPSARAASMRSQSPLAVHRRNWRCTEFQLPSSSGRSRQGAPVRAIQKMASSVRRWSRGGRPRSGPASVTKGSKNVHSASLNRPRITADLLHEDQRRITPHRVGGIPPRALCPRRLDAGWLSLFRRGVGHSAVVVFFVLSGFVIAGTIHRIETARDYLIKRLSRVYSVALPALLLAVAVDTVSMKLALPTSNSVYELHKPWLYIPLHLLFAGDLWSLRLAAFSDTPYWSLNYEVWYYLAFGLAVFLRSWSRVVGVGLVLLVMGPKLWLLFPLWLAGVGVYALQKRAVLPRNAARAVAAGAVLALFVFMALGLDEPISAAGLSAVSSVVGLPLRFSQWFLADYIMGSLTAVLVWALCGIDLWPPRTVRFIGVNLAKVSFSLYLVHFPLILLCHKSGRRLRRWQQGQRGTTRAIARAMTVRTEVIEVAT